MRETVLVTGGAGFAGRALIDALHGHGVCLTAWHRPGTSPPDAPGVQWRGVDLLNAAAVRAAVADTRPAAVYHCAGAAHVGQSWQHAETTLRVNVLGTHHLLDAIRLARLQPRLLIPSSAMVYAIAETPIAETAPLQPRSPYALSKLAQEMVSRHGLEPGMPPACIARSFNHLGPRQDAAFAGSSFARQIACIEAGLTAPVLKVGNLEAERDFTDVRDTVLAYRAMLEDGEPGSTYNVCSGRAVAVGELLDRLLTRSTVSIRVERDPARQRPHDQPRLVGDNSRIRRELGWEPRIPLDQTIEDLLAYWRTRVRVGV